MTIMEALAAYFKRFPGLAGKRLNIDCLSMDPDCYSLDTVPTEPVVKTYISGERVMRKTFVLASRCYYADEQEQLQSNAAFFEDLELWVGNNEIFGVLPDLGAGRKPRSLTINSSAYVFVVDDNGTARYQLQMELIYLQEVNRP